MVTDKLTEQVRRKLNITWNDTETDARVAEIIESVVPYMLHKLGITDPNFDFSAPGTENMLFLACCLYEWNHATMDEFEENYHRTIANVRARYEVLYYKVGGLGGLNSLVRLATINLRVSDWVEDGDNYVQTVTIDEVEAYNRIDLQPTPEQLVQLQDDETTLTVVNDNGVVKVYAIGEKPTVDYEMQVTITEVT